MGISELSKHMMDSNRRKLMQLGALGMPMMFTLRASAQSVVVSALQCTITIPRSWVILVDDSGAAWLGDMSWSQNDQLTTNKVQSLKSNSSFEFPAGAVDQNFRPSGNCDDDDDDDDGKKGKKGKHDDDDDDVSCQYKVYSTGQSSEFPISEFVDENGNWNFEDVSGLYVSLAAQYAVQSNDTSGFPGVSCLVSVLNYLQTNN